MLSESCSTPALDRSGDIERGPSESGRNAQEYAIVWWNLSAQMIFTDCVLCSVQNLGVKGSLGKLLSGNEIDLAVSSGSAPSTNTARKRKPA